MTIEVWDGNSWEDADDPEICTAVNPTTGAGTFTNIQRGQIWTGSAWESFYIRSAGEGAIAKTPIIEFYKKGSRKIQIYVSHENTTGDKVTVLVYATKGATGNFLYNSGTKSNPDSGYDIDGFSNEIEFFGSNDYNSLLDNNPATDESAGDGFILYKGAAYNISCVAFYYNNSNGLIKSVGGNSISITTHPYYHADTPISLGIYKSSSSISMLSYGNAYNNGTAWLRWQYQSRNAGSGSGWTNLVTVDDSLNTLTNNQTTEYSALNFTGLSFSKEYQFRARVVYAGLGNSNSEVGAWSAYSNSIRPIYPVETTIPNYASINNTTYFNAVGTTYDNSQIGINLNYLDNNTPAKASDNDTSTYWSSDPYAYPDPISTTITSAKRDGSYVYYSGSGLSSLVSVTNITVTNMNRLRGNILTTKRENGGSSTFYVNIKGGGSVIYPFNASDNSVVIAGLSDSVTNGTKNLDKRADDNELRYISFVSAYDSAYKSDVGTIISATSGGSAVSNLNVKNKQGELQTVGASTVKVATADAGTTLQFSLMDVLGDGTNDPTMVVTGTTAKGAGTETLHAYFSVKDSYVTPRIEAGDNYILVRNGPLATDILVSLNGTALNTGDTSFGANSQRVFTSPTTKYANYASEFVKNAFRVTLAVTRVNTGFGYYAQVKEVQIKFKHTEQYNDGIT